MVFSIFDGGGYPNAHYVCIYWTNIYTYIYVYMFIHYILYIYIYILYIYIYICICIICHYMYYMYYMYYMSLFLHFYFYYVHLFFKNSSICSHFSQMFLVLLGQSLIQKSFTVERSLLGNYFGVHFGGVPFIYWELLNPFS